MLVGKTWDGAVQRWLADNSEKRSLKSDQSNILWLNKFLSDVRLSDIDSGVVHSVRTKKIASGVSNATVNRMLALLRAILRMAVVEWMDNTGSSRAAAPGASSPGSFLVPQTGC